MRRSARGSEADRQKWRAAGAAREAGRSAFRSVAVAHRAHMFGPRPRPLLVGVATVAQVSAVRAAAAGMRCSGLRDLYGPGRSRGLGRRAKRRKGDERAEAHRNQHCLHRSSPERWVRVPADRTFCTSASGRELAMNARRARSAAPCVRRSCPATKGRAGRPGAIEVRAGLRSGSDEAFAEHDGESGFCLGPFAKRHFHS